MTFTFPYSQASLPNHRLLNTFQATVGSAQNTGTPLVQSLRSFQLLILNWMSRVRSRCKQPDNTIELAQIQPTSGRADTWIPHSSDVGRIWAESMLLSGKLDNQKRSVRLE